MVVPHGAEWQNKDLIDLGSKLDFVTDQLCDFGKVMQPL